MDRLIKVHEVAGILGISVPSIYRLRSNDHNFPRQTHLGKCALWSEFAVREYMARKVAEVR